MKTPFFSIVTAIKDGLNFFKETAPTVLAQTDKDFEWIVYDDFSNEPLGEYVKSLGDSRIKFHRNSESLGQTRSLNLGIRKAKGQWIVRMDGDDLADPRRLELTRKKISDSTDLALIFSDYDVIDEDGSFIATVRYRDPLDEGFFQYLAKNNPICHPSVTFRKKARDGERYVFDEKLQNAQDYALWKRIFRDYGIHGFGHVGEPLIKYRLVRQSLSGARAAEQKAELEAIRTKLVDRPGAGKAVLNAHQQQGMQAYRSLYYRFIGEGSRGRSFLSDVSDLWTATQYPPVVLKSIAYFTLRPLKGFMKAILFNKIYR